MKNKHKIYLCTECGEDFTKWSGQCPSCGAWNTLKEHTVEGGTKALKVATVLSGALELVGLDDPDLPEPARIISGNEEFDRALGGGVVPGSAILIGGDPGVGKSTLLIQMMSKFAQNGARAVYVSGEEGTAQIKMRARRLGLAQAKVELAAETSLSVILNGLKKGPKVDVLVIDSVQTVYSDSAEAAPGTVTQLRAVTHDLVNFAKKNDIVVIMVGHVTKEGQLAGPRMVEHMVDAVIYFEGDKRYDYRLLRAVKNRFGPADEIGVFEMRETGLEAVVNPSALFLENDGEAKPGAAIFAGVEGSRPILTEVQALIVPAPYGTPRRSVVGWEGGRLSMIMAVAEARAGAVFGGFDVFLNVVGGLKITDPALDLAAAAALFSALRGTPLPEKTVFFGEVTLTGSVRSVRSVEARLKEAEKLGFTRAIIPDNIKAPSRSLDITRVKEIAQLSEIVRPET